MSAAPDPALALLPRPGFASWRNLLLLGLVLAALLQGIHTVRSEAARTVSFVFTDLDQRTIRLADYRGKWVLVSFWAPWCPLCKVQVPSLNQLNQRPDFRVIGIALDYGADETAIRNVVAANQLRFEAQVAGGSRKSPNNASLQVGPVDFFPTSYLYDPTGEIVLFIPGQLRVSRVLAFMDQWQAERGGRAPVIAARTERLAAYLRERHGEAGARAFADWKRLVDANLGATPAQQLERVNAFFNQRIRFETDRQIWGRDDYWASPGELLGAGRGDAEDFAIAKYFTLLALNVPPEALRLVYVRPLGETRQAAGAVHMVLAHYPSPDAEPTILDNLRPRPQSARQRTDLQPVFSFNSLGVWEEAAQVAAGGDPRRLANWQDTLRRARAQGFE